MWVRASYIQSVPMRGVGSPVMSLVASVAMMEPMVPQSDPSTPPAAQVGTESAGGISG